MNALTQRTLRLSAEVEVTQVNCNVWFYLGLMSSKTYSRDLISPAIWIRLMKWVVITTTCFNITASLRWAWVMLPGHGLESGVLMLMTQMGIRTLMTNDESDPTRFSEVSLNRTLYDNVQRMGIDKSLTLMLLDYTPPDNGNVAGQLRVSGQHEELIVVRKGGQIERIDTLDLGFPVALEEDIAKFVSHVECRITAWRWCGNVY